MYPTDPTYAPQLAGECLTSILPSLINAYQPMFISATPCDPNS